MKETSQLESETKRNETKRSATRLEGKIQKLTSEVNGELLGVVLDDVDDGESLEKEMRRRQVSKLVRTKRGEGRRKRARELT